MGNDGYDCIIAGWVAEILPEYSGNVQDLNK